METKAHEEQRLLIGMYSYVIICWWVDKILGGSTLEKIAFGNKGQ